MILCRSKRNFELFIEAGSGMEFYVTNDPQKSDKVIRLISGVAYPVYQIGPSAGKATLYHLIATDLNGFPVIISITQGFLDKILEIDKDLSRDAYLGR